MKNGNLMGFNYEKWWSNLVISRWDLASGNLLQSYWKWPIEIVDLPIDSMVIFHRYVSLPEGMCGEWLSDSFWLVVWNHGILWLSNSWE